MKTGESWLSHARTGIVMLTSSVALLVSGYSFSETVVKQPELRIYQPPLIYMYRENGRDVFAVPITLSNDGDRRGTAVSFDLEVTQRETGKKMKFQSLKVGQVPNAGARLFAPMTVAGGGSTTEVVLFYALAGGSFVESTGPVKLPLRFALKMNVDIAGDRVTPAPVVFEMTANYIQSFNHMEAGDPTELHDTR